MENFLTAFENYFIEILFELARKDTLTLHSALCTLNSALEKDDPQCYKKL